MSEERGSLVSKMLPEWDDCITIAEYRPDAAPLPPPIPRERAVILVDVDDVWMADAACTGQPQAWWYPPGEGPGRIDVETRELEDRAKAVCAGCSVRADCLAYALKTKEPYGIWGGLAPRERGLVRMRAGQTLLQSDSLARQKRRRRAMDRGADHRPPPDAGDVAS